MTMPSVTLAILVVLLAFIAPVVFERKGVRAFLVFVALMWLGVIAVANPIVLSLEFWISSTGEASAGFFATAIGYGLPVWATAVCIWILKKFHASTSWQFYASVLAGLLFSAVSATVAFFIALVLIEGG